MNRHLAVFVLGNIICEEMDMPSVPPVRKRAFTLIELLLVVAIIALLIAILIPALASARKVARSGMCMSNMRMFNTGIQNYSGDASGLVASFSWQPGVPTPSDFADNSITPSNATQAHARQAVEYIRKLAGETSFFPPNIADHRIVARNFTQVVLMYGGYYGDRNPEPAAACSEDRDLLQWQKLTPAQAQAQFTAWDMGAPSFFAPYFSSYQIVPNAFQDEKGPGQLYHVPTDYRLYYVGAGGRFKQRRLDQVAFPSQKVAWFDLFDRHSYKRPIYYAYNIARQPLAFFDGSVRVGATKDANKGWSHQAGQQNNLSLTARVEYRTISPTDPPPLYSSATANIADGFYRWTRKGIKGIDFGGAEVTR